MGSPHKMNRMEVDGDFARDYDFQNIDGRGYRILSIQSHVVSGYVGNRSAVFPLQVNVNNFLLVCLRIYTSFCCERRSSVSTLILLIQSSYQITLVK